MSGVLFLAALARMFLRTTITVGTDGVSAYGYNSGLYGSIATATFKDGGGTTRTVAVVIWNGANIQFWLLGASIPNTYATFEGIMLTGSAGTVTLKRSDATYNGSAGGGTHSSWVWANSTQPSTTGGASVTLAVQ